MSFGISARILTYQSGFCTVFHCSTNPFVPSSTAVQKNIFLFLPFIASTTRRPPGVCLAARATVVVETRSPSAWRCCQRDEPSVFASGCAPPAAHPDAGCACRVRPSPARAHGQPPPMTYQFISTVAFGMRGRITRPRIPNATFPRGNVRARIPSTRARTHIPAWVRHFGARAHSQSRARTHIAAWERHVLGSAHGCCAVCIGAVHSRADEAVHNDLAHLCMYMMAG